MSGAEQLSLEGLDPGGEVRSPAGTADGPQAPAAAGAVLPPTPEQAAATAARDRDVFLEAGAGTGKTRVLVDRYCEAVDTDRVEPERILAFTFTEKAAGEMRRRVRVELMRRARSCERSERRARLQRAAHAGEAAPITTIHGFCRRLIGAHPIAAGLDPGFRVLDADEAGRLAIVAFDSALADLGARDPEVAGAAAAHRDRLSSLIRGAHSECRNHGRRPELPPLQINAFEGDAAEGAGAAELELAEARYRALGRLLVAFAERYADLKRERSGVDFDDLQTLALGLLRASPAVARAQQERFDHLLVDEFQDTSPLQVELIRGLLGPGTRLFSVGDEFQSIYAFRGADLETFRAERDQTRERLGPDAVLALTGSFRSSPEIVAAVNLVGGCLLEDFRPLRVGVEPAEPASAPSGPAVEVLAVGREGWNDEGIELRTTSESPPNRVAEARNLARRLRRLADQGVDPGSMVVLLRAFTHVDAFAEALELAGLDPYVVGGRGYWSAQQVEDALRLLACVANPLEDEALLGALASPACAASPDALWILRRIAGPRRHLWPAMRAHLLEIDDPGRAEAEPQDRTGPDEGGETDEQEHERRRRAEEWAARLPETDRARLTRFARILARLRERAALLPLDALVETTLEAFDYDLGALAMPGGDRRAANLLKLVRLAAEYEAHEGRDLRGFLSYASERAALSDREAEATIAAEDHPGVTVMTVHAAKGLEFEVVAVADLGRNRVAGGAPPELRLSFAEGDPGAAERRPAGDGGPDPRVGLRLARTGAGPLSLEGYQEIEDAAAEADAQEAGRLAYVAASRARRRLILSGICEDRDLEGGREERTHSQSVLSLLLPALGVGPEGGVVAIPPAEPRAGLELETGPVEVAVEVLRPSAEVAAGLSDGLTAAEPADELPPAARPPLIALAERGGSAARSLSYAALADYERCGYRFLIERVIGLENDRPALGPRAEEDVGARAPGSGRFGFGRAVHALLEAGARSGWRRPGEDEVAARLAAEGLSSDRTPEAIAMLERWLDSDLLAELVESGARLRAEVPFRVLLGRETVLRGTIDLLAEAPSRPPLVVDYKTDSRPPAPGEPLGENYLIQRALYAHAVTATAGAEEVESAYVFLADPGRTLRETLDATAIAAGRERIDRLIEGIRDRRFVATGSPHRDLCHDCPARRRLCPHPPELTLGAP